jgi:hypothetical protein
MLCEGKLKLRSNSINYCLIEVVTKAGEGISLLNTNYKKIYLQNFLSGITNHIKYVWYNDDDITIWQKK